MPVTKVSVERLGDLTDDMAHRRYDALKLIGPSILFSECPSVTMTSVSQETIPVIA